MPQTLVLGASLKPNRFSYKAVRELRMYGFPTVAIGLREGVINDVQVIKGYPELEDIDTITLYLGPPRQVPLYNYILSLNPRRIIFNPGTENPELMELAESQGIETIEDCTLVMLELGMF